MRIAMISTPCVAVPPKDYGGTELVVFELVEGLVERGHEVSLFATGDSNTRANLHWLFPEAQWPPSWLTEVNHISWALSQLANEQYDIIHAHSASALAFRRFMPARPMIYTIHHEQEPELSEFYEHFQDVVYIAISYNQKRLETRLRHCEVIHHGLDPGRFECADKASDYVCFVGRFSEVKGPHLAIDVAAQAGVTIRVAGQVHPPDREFAARELEHRLVQPHVKFDGALGASQKKEFFRDARALLAPIDWEEPFGLIFIEAMLSGCPPVAFPRGSVPELIESGITGFVVQTTDEMAELIRPGGVLDSFDRHRCRARAVKRFSRDRFVSDHLRLYERVLAATQQNYAIQHVSSRD